MLTGRRALRHNCVHLFGISQLPKLRPLEFLTWNCASLRNSVQLFTSYLATQLAEELLEKAQLERKTVEEVFKVDVETDSTKRWKNMLADRTQAKSRKASSSSSSKLPRSKGKGKPVAKTQLQHKARPIY